MSKTNLRKYFSENYRTDESYEEHFILKLILVSKTVRLKDFWVLNQLKLSSCKYQNFGK